MSAPTQKEALYFLKHIRGCTDSLPHPIARLEAIHWKKMHYSVLGKFSHLKPSRIYLNSKYRSTPELLVSTVAHELRHKWQWENEPVRYLAACASFSRRWLLEPTANEVEAVVDAYMGVEGIGDGDR
jgi:hypothetical protein